MVCVQGGRLLLIRHWYCFSFLLLFVLFKFVLSLQCDLRHCIFYALFKSFQKVSKIFHLIYILWNEFKKRWLYKSWEVERGHMTRCSDPQVHYGPWWRHTGLCGGGVGKCALICGDGGLLVLVQCLITTTFMRVRMCVCVHERDVTGFTLPTLVHLKKKREDGGWFTKLHYIFIKPHKMQIIFCFATKSAKVCQQ